MKQVFIIASHNEFDLQNRVNEFLRDFEDKLIDIKFAINDRPQSLLTCINKFFVLIIYEEKEKK